LESRVVGGRYQVLRELGHGGMAEVFLARDLRLGREVAVKVLYPHLSKDPEGRSRFHREAQATARLRHENIVEIHDFSGAESDEMYIVTEYIHGITLRHLVESRPPGVPEVGAMIVQQVLRGLEAAHALSIIHRDIKPENVMLRQDGAVKLMDFGIARVHGAQVQGLTQSDVLLGSPLYMAPEQLEDVAPDARLDLFAAGILLYYLVTGRLPFSGDSTPQLLKRIAAGTYQPPDKLNPAVGAGLVRVIRRALQVNRDQRYQTAAAFRLDLEACLAEAGVESVERELREWFRAPEAWEQAFCQRLSPLLIARGRTLYQAGQLAPAMDCFNRLLVLDPGNQEVLRLLKRSEQRRGLARGVKRLAWVVIGTTLVTGLAALALWLAEERPRTLPRPWSEVRKQLPPAPVVHPKLPRRALETPLHSAARRPPSPSLSRPLTPRPEQTAAAVSALAQVATFPVTIVAFPPAVAIWVDGRQQGVGRVNDLPLTPGRHRVLVHHPSCADCIDTTYEIVIDPRNPPKVPFRVSIRQKR
jgi:serine/threonine-protein kinase